MVLRKTERRSVGHQCFLERIGPDPFSRELAWEGMWSMRCTIRPLKLIYVRALISGLPRSGLVECLGDSVERHRDAL